MLFMSSREFMLSVPSARIIVPIFTADLAELLNALESSRDTANGACGPVDQDPPGIRSAAGKARKRSASGQAAAKARRTRAAVSVTRAAIFSRRSRRVANSAFARSRCAGMASRTGEHQPVGRRVQNEPGLVGERRAAGGSIRAKLRLMQFDEVFRLSARAIEAVV